ncbi:MAG TPA: nucleoside recognition domain-containing protein [Bacilli bacterium]|nr:MAG: Nucleoside recognition [Tenericutes bacterium ADurb.BinA124]HNZ50990.1 nucleoside recognition domain-containing protein [Bacilli bacterium]HPN60924.1 nucleoside recognition domain-containing protein [Bacilli bacterium]HPX84305.1 nucleoside recognition domain-containing protein [Bacilli bacterium]HQC74324.1 nucleoside recognition domain-containing protein [Bacilli bacterium]
MAKVLTFIKDFLLPTLLSLGMMLLKIIVIITLILVTIEVLKALKVLQWINKKIYVITKYLGISPSASFPLLVGLIIGITYGAGVILMSYKQQEMNKKDVLLVSVFLCLCHAIVEDTLLFAAFGSITWVVIVVKLVVAFTTTMLVNLILKLIEHRQLAKNPD